MGEPPSNLKSRPLTLTYEIPIGKTQKFWQELKGGKVVATRCKKCRELLFPPAADCPHCLSTDTEWVELSGEARIEAFTHIEVRPISFQHREPYTVAVGRLKEGVKVLAWLTGVKLKDVKVGMKAKLVAKVTPEGETTYVFVST